MLDRRRGGGHIPRKYLYSGSFAGLVNGTKYTLRELSDAAGISPKTMHSRVRAKACKIITDYDLRKAKSIATPTNKPLESRLESHADLIRDKWLRRKIV